MYFDRFDILSAYTMYAMLYSPVNDIQARLNRIEFRLGCNARLESLSSNAREIYGNLVKQNNRLMVGFDRLYKRRPQVAGMWPGTYNIPGGDIRKYLQSRGILEAVESYV